MLEIRRYRAEDRAQVRKICVETAYLGDSILPEFGDAESFADTFTGYYTDREPESAWVVADGERVLGYLLGCMDTRNSPAPEWVITKHIVRRGLWARPGTAGFCFRSLFDTLRDLGPTRPALDYGQWPAHAHIDLLPEARKGALGLRLFRMWLDVARERGAAGTWGASFVENEAASLMHRALGFRPSGAAFPATGMRTRAGERMHAQLWVRELSPAHAPARVPSVAPAAAVRATVRGC
jgi:hypothetical protein